MQTSGREGSALSAGEVQLQQRGLDVAFGDGSSAYFNYYWLRHNCASSFDPETRERTYDIISEARAPKPSSAEVIDGQLRVAWQGSNHVSAFSLSWLADHARGERRPDPANLPRRYWYSDKYDSIARFRQRDLVADPSLRAAWIEALIVDGLAIVDDMPDTDAGLEETAVLIGTIRPSFFGKFFEVKIHIQPTNLAFTAAALELHTDVPAEDMAPGIQFLHCRANSAAGGASLFADGATVAAELRAVAPSDFKLLAETSIPFYCEHEEFDMRARQRVIECDEHGEITGVTISQHVADVFDLPQAFLDAYYPAFCRFGKMLQSDKFLMRFRLNPGECIVFDNHRVVHGREPYAAASGERHLRGCYTDRGEMRSTYRVLKGRETCR